MSHNHNTLLCPECGRIFTVDNSTFSPVCPGCGYARNGDEDKPKFGTVDLNYGEGDKDVL
jgi:hypothetical protein